MDKFEFGNLLRTNRERMKLSRKQLSDKTGISEGIIRNYENAKTKYSPDSLKSLSAYLQISEDYFYDFVEENESEFKIPIDVRKYCEEYSKLYDERNEVLYDKAVNSQATSYFKEILTKIDALLIYSLRDSFNDNMFKRIREFDSLFETIALITHLNDKGLEQLNEYLRILLGNPNYTKEQPEKPTEDKE